MEIFLDVLLTILILTNFRLLGTSRLGACIQTVIIQAIALGLLPIATHGSPLGLRITLFAILIIIVKAVILPWLLRRTAREVSVPDEVEPFLGFTASILVGALLLGLCFVISGHLQPFAVTGQNMLIPGSLFTIMAGLFLIVSRRNALMQVLGYLVMENGVYAFGVAFAIQEPFLVEMGVLLDVFVAVFVMGIAINNISREFDHIDTDRLSTLKE